MIQQPSQHLLDGFVFLSITSLASTAPPFPTRPCAPVAPSTLWQDSGDEIIKPLGILLWVHCGDLRTGLESKHTHVLPDCHRFLKPLLYTATYPVFDGLGGVGCFLLGIIMLKDVYDSHEVHLLPGSSCSIRQTARIRIFIYAQQPRAKVWFCLSKWHPSYFWQHRVWQLEDTRGSSHHCIDYSVVPEQPP